MILKNTNAIIMMVIYLDLRFLSAGPFRNLFAAHISYMQKASDKYSEMNLVSKRFTQNTDMKWHELTQRPIWADLFFFFFLLLVLIGYDRGAVGIPAMAYGDSGDGCDGYWPWVYLIHNTMFINHQLIASTYHYINSKSCVFPSFFFFFSFFLFFFLGKMPADSLEKWWMKRKNIVTTFVDSANLHGLR